MSQVVRWARHSRIDSERASVSTTRDDEIVFSSTHSQLFERAVSQSIWRNEYRELPRGTAVAERVCEYGGACSRVSHADDVYLGCILYLEDMHRSLRAVPTVSTANSSC